LRDGGKMKIGVAQVNLAESVRENTEKILDFVERGLKEGLSCLAFPETALSGYVYDRFLTLDYASVSAALERVAKRLRGTALTAVLGTPFEEKGVRYNSAAVIRPDGKRLLYHKNLLVSYEEKYFKPGVEKLVFEAAGRSFGVMICRDQNSPELARELAGKGARGVFILSAHYYDLVESRMKREKNRALPIARAYENGLYVFKSNAVGSMQGKISYGGSMLVDPRGIVIREAGDRGEELLVCDVDLDKENPRW
jgi:predicted amidohydrolase